MNGASKFIGAGLIFPIEIDAKGRAITSDGFELLRSSIIHILSWPKNTRWFNERFGVRLWEVLEEPNDVIGISLVRTFIIEAIKLWEPRVELLDIVVITDTASLQKIEIELTYRIRNSKTEDTFIFPFYKELIY